MTKLMWNLILKVTWNLKTEDLTMDLQLTITMEISDTTNMIMTKDQNMKKN